MLKKSSTGDCKSKLLVGHREEMPILQLKFDNLWFDLLLRT